MSTHARRLDDENCPYCDGTLYEEDFTTYCGDCDSVVGQQEHRQDILNHLRPDDRWDEFERNRPRYRSGKKKCVGGFLQAYDWIGPDEAGGPVGSVTPEKFYK